MSCPICCRCNVLTGKVGLLIGEITPKTPFIGYVGNKILTEKKHLRDVFRKGDIYFNSGDLMMLDHDNFIYFQDRIGDTYRSEGAGAACGTLTRFCYPAGHCLTFKSAEL